MDEKMQEVLQTAEQILNSEWYQRCKDCKFWYGELMQCMYPDEFHSWAREAIGEVNPVIPDDLMNVPCKTYLRHKEK